jgi:alpha-ketoglutarate-dependent taurine dioxygenase
MKRETHRLLVTRSIVGLKKEESEALLAFLFNHIGRGVDYQARVRWAPKTVVAWDVSTTTRDGSSGN